MHPKQLERTKITPQIDTTLNPVIYLLYLSRRLISHSCVVQLRPAPFVSTFTDFRRRDAVVLVDVRVPSWYRVWGRGSGISGRARYRECKTW
ncbi:hypothetical protein AAHA92_25416 [Salvia divinorum]|uniref:Uncharacterized protein n=1 Tax=Salvia divinorum TaxID=28513 RepID=A0ABD1GAM7_SALDI